MSKIGIIKNTFPPGNDGTHHGAGQITETSSGKKFVFQIPSDIDPTMIPLQIGMSVIFETTNGHDATGVAKALTEIAIVSFSGTLNEQIITFSWNVTGADTLEINNGVGYVTPSTQGTVDFAFAGIDSFVLSASNKATGAAMKQLAIKILVS
jgi:hypothetical protein